MVFDIEIEFAPKRKKEDNAFEILPTKSIQEKTKIVRKNR